MADDRCFRIDELDLDEIRDRTRDRNLIDAYSNWIRNFAPLVDEVIDQVSAAFADTRREDALNTGNQNRLV